MSDERLTDEAIIECDVDSGRYEAAINILLDWIEQQLEMTEKPKDE